VRALEPSASGTVERDGVQLYWESFGEGETTLVLLPTWSIIPSTFWKLQVPYLARHHRVVTFDGRGSGRSSRPTGAEAYTHHELAADTLAVLDATTTGPVPVASSTARVSAANSWCVYASAPVGPDDRPLPRPSNVTTRW